MCLLCWILNIHCRIYVTIKAHGYLEMEWRLPRGVAFQCLGKMYAFCSIFSRVYLKESDSILETKGKKKVDKRCRHNVCLRMICHEQKQSRHKTRAHNPHILTRWYISWHGSWRNRVWIYIIFHAIHDYAYDISLIWH